MDPSVNLHSDDWKRKAYKFKRQLEKSDPQQLQELWQHLDFTSVYKENTKLFKKCLRLWTLNNHFILSSTYSIEKWKCPLLSRDWNVIIGEISSCSSRNVTAVVTYTPTTLVLNNRFVKLHVALYQSSSEPWSLKAWASKFLKSGDLFDLCFWDRGWWWVMDQQVRQIPAHKNTKRRSETTIKGVMWNTFTQSWTSKCENLEQIVD